MDRRCSISEETLFGIKTVIMENGLLWVRILAGKGGEIYQMVYKPSEMDILLKTPGGLGLYENRNLYEKRLTWYSELYTGGWSDVVPDRGTYQDIFLVQKTSGIAATLPWGYEIAEDSPRRAEIRCFVQLPDFPLYIEKFIAVNRGSAKLEVREAAVNKGAAPMEFTWTQHAAFGGGFFDETVRISLPAEKIFRALEYSARAPGASGRIEDYESLPEEVRFQDGSIHNFLMAPPREKECEHFVTMRNLREAQAVMYHPGKKIGVRLS